jgi:hypothetical protein
MRDMKEECNKGKEILEKKSNWNSGNEKFSKLNNKLSRGLDTVAHACNPSYSGESRFKAIPSKKFTISPSQPMAGCGGMYLLSQPFREAQIEGSPSRPA